MPVAESVVWSKSQVSSFQECERKHALSTWMAPEGIETNEQWARVRRLKKLSSRHLWPGSIVHTEIGEALKTVRQGNPPPEIESWLDRVREQMRGQFRSSRTDPNADLRFFEHEYSVPLPKEIWAEPWTKVETCLRRFYGSSWLERLQAIGPECWKAVDEVVSFSVDEIKAYVKIDCAVEIEGNVTILDWKAAPLRDNEEFGLQTAALYAHEVWGAEPSAVQAIAVSLIDGKTHKLVVDEESLMETHLRIQTEASPLGNLDRNADPFGRPMTSRRQTCERCNFKQLCHPKGTSYVG